MNDEVIDVAIIGSGFSGIGMAIQLKKASIDNFRIFERSQDVGGTWRDNTYPGCACDVPSHLYSFSFEPNPNWPRKFSAYNDIHAYLRKRVPPRQTVAFPDTILYDRDTRQLVPDKQAAPPHDTA